MPREVELGEGYTGDALLAAFPGQYRDAAMESNTFDTSGWNRQSPMAASGQVRAVNPPTDPDAGRPLVLQEVPGVGQIAAPMGAVIPVDHYMAGNGVGAVVPVEHRMADWQGTAFAGMGGITAAFVGLLGREDLDKLASAMLKVQDAGLQGEEQVRALLASDQARREALAAAQKTFVPLLSTFPPIPNPFYLIAAAPLVKAGNGEEVQVELLARTNVNFSVMIPMLGELRQSLLSAGLSNDAEVVKYAQNALQRFQTAIEYQVRPVFQKIFDETQAAIYSLFTDLLQRNNLTLTSYDDDRFWFYLDKAGRQVVPDPVEGLAVPEPVGGVAGMGSLGAVVTAAIIGIVKTILWIVAVVGALLTINAIVDKLTAASRQTVDMAYEAQKRASMRLEEANRAAEADRALVAAGKMTIEEADARAKARAAETDKANEKDVEKTLDAAERAAGAAAETAPSVTKTLLNMLLPIGLAIGALTVLPKLL